MRWNLVIGLIALITLVGCTATIDTSSEERMEESVEEIRDTLSGSDLDEFDEAMMTLAFSSIGEDLFDPDVDEDAMEKRMLEDLDGKNAREIVAEAEKFRLNHIIASNDHTRISPPFFALTTFFEINYCRLIHHIDPSVVQAVEGSRWNVVRR